VKNKIALEEHFAIEGMTYKNDVMDAPTFAEVRRRLADTESLRIEAMDKAGIELSILSFFRLAFKPKPIPMSPFSTQNGPMIFFAKMS
jgi:hypothetical protein